MKEKIIIIGAGISGLYLAYLLQNKYAVTLLESRERIGGRIHSIDGHDMGPSWIWLHHKHILSFIDELGLNLFSQYTHGDSLYDTQVNVERFTSPQSAPSSRMEGSLTLLVQTLYKKLENVQVEFLEEVISIIQTSENVEVRTKKSRYASKYVISTLPPRLVSTLEFTPSLPSELLKKLQSTQTWMGNSAKCVVEFEDSFWRMESLSGFVYSPVGPLGEIHDACTKDKAALFGFVHSNANMDNFEHDVREQISRLFGTNASKITAIYLVDWKREGFTSTQEDCLPLRAHPQYGIDTSTYSQRVLFSSTEFSQEEGGYLEGAIIRAKSIAEGLLEL